MANAAARTMEAFQRGLLTLDRLQNGGRQTVVVTHLQQVQVGTGGQAVVTGSSKPKGRNGEGVAGNERGTPWPAARLAQEWKLAGRLSSRPSLRRQDSNRSVMSAPAMATAAAACMAG